MTGVVVDARRGEVGGRKVSRASDTVSVPGRARRRPSGQAPPLPRPIGASGRGWLVTGVVAVIWVIACIHLTRVQQITDTADASVLRALAEVRTGWLTTTARAVDRVATGWAMFVVAMLLLLVTIAWKRWRQLFAFLVSVVAVRLIGLTLHAAYRRPRPFDVTTIGRWTGYSSPSAIAAVVSIAAIGAVYIVVVPGRPRTVAKFVAAAVICTVVGARLYLGVDHPFDAITGVALGVALPLLAFRYFAPSEIVPGSYRRGKTAHLDMTGPRGDAVRRAVEEQWVRPCSTSTQSASPARVVRPRCGSASPVIPTRSSSASCTR